MPNSLRIPPTPENRSYLKLLRTAEATRWTEQPTQEDTRTLRLASVTESVTETWLLRILGIVALTAAAYAIINVSWLFDSWTALAKWTELAIGG
jgi:hypothetical protein